MAESVAVAFVALGVRVRKEGPGLLICRSLTTELPREAPEPVRGSSFATDVSNGLVSRSARSTLGGESERSNHSGGRPRRDRT